MKIAVIGAGINGLSSAWALARDGHDVTVYEQGPIPNPLGSSVDQNRLIRFPYGASIGYTRMVFAAYEAWELLWADLGETLYARTGTLAIARDESSWADLSAATLAHIGLEVRRLSPADIERIFPMLRTDGIRYALHLDSGGELFASRIIEALARHLRARDVELFERTPVESVDVERARATLRDGSTIACDALVIGGRAVGEPAVALDGGARHAVAPGGRVCRGAGAVRGALAPRTDAHGSGWRGLLSRAALWRHRSQGGRSSLQPRGPARRGSRAGPGRSASGVRASAPRAARFRSIPREGHAHVFLHRAAARALSGRTARSGMAGQRVFGPRLQVRGAQRFGNCGRHRGPAHR